MSDELQEELPHHLQTHGGWKSKYCLHESRSHKKNYNCKLNEDSNEGFDENDIDTIFPAIHGHGGAVQRGAGEGEDGANGEMVKWLNGEMVKW